MKKWSLMPVSVLAILLCMVCLVSRTSADDWGDAVEAKGVAMVANTAAVAAEGVAETDKETVEAAEDAYEEKDDSHLICCEADKIGAVAGVGYMQYEWGDTMYGTAGTKFTTGTPHFTAADAHLLLQRYAQAVVEYGKAKADWEGSKLMHGSASIAYLAAVSDFEEAQDLIDEAAASEDCIFGCEDEVGGGMP